MKYDKRFRKQKHKGPKGTYQEYRWLVEVNTGGLNHPDIGLEYEIYKFNEKTGHFEWETRLRIRTVKYGNKYKVIPRLEMKINSHHLYGNYIGLGITVHKTMSQTSKREKRIEKSLYHHLKTHDYVKSWRPPKR